MTDKSNSKKEHRFEASQDQKSCPTCGERMEKGFLNTSGSGIQRVFIQPEVSDTNTPVHITTSVLFCPDCKHAFLIID